MTRCVGGALGPATLGPTPLGPVVQSPAVLVAILPGIGTLFLAVL